MGQIVLWIIIIAAFAMMFKIAYDSDRKRKWFNSLKVGDKIKVWIYSQYCECLREAEVTQPSDGKFLEAKVADDCSACSEARSKNKKGEETCWHKVTVFKKEDVGQI